MESGGIPYDLVSPIFAERIAFQFLDEISASIVVIRNDGEIVYANSQAHQDLGFKLGTLCDQSINDLVHDRESRLLKKWNGLRNEGKLNFKELIFSSATGASHLFEIKAKLHNDSIDEFAICTLQNLSRQKETNRRSMIAQIAFENTTDLIYVIGSDARIVDVNEGAIAALGYSRQEFLGLHVKVINPNYSPKHFLSLQVRLNLEGSAKYESYRRHKDGTIFPVEVSASFHQVDDEVFYFIVARNISQRKKVEADLLKTQFSVDNCSDAVFWFNQHGRFVYVNRAACSSLGYTEQELKKLYFTDIEDGMTEEEIQVAIDSLKSKKQMRFESRHIRKDGKVFPVDIVANAHQIGNELFFCATVRDLTEFKQHENLIHDLSAQLAHVNRLSSMGELASAIAHELNQPLTSISTNAFILNSLVSKLRPTVFLNQDDNAINMESLTDDIMNQALMAGEIVHGMRGFVAHRVAEKERTDLNLVVAQAIKMAVPQISSLNVRLESHLAEEELLANVDPIQIQQIIINLIRNSLDSLTDVKQENRSLYVRTRRKRNGFSIVTVRDSGPGVPANAVKGLFSPFETTKDGGMGLGLSISCSIARNHGGKLIHNPDYEKGAEFKLMLPPLENPHD